MRRCHEFSTARGNALEEDAVLRTSASSNGIIILKQNHIHISTPPRPQSTQHQNFHQFLRPRNPLSSQCLVERGTPPRSINRHIPDLFHIEGIFSIGTDHIDKDDACPVCEAVWKDEGGIVVPTEAYGSVGVISADFSFRVEAVDEVCAGELRLVWWGLVEAACFGLESIGDVEDGCARKCNVEALC